MAQQQAMELIPDPDPTDVGRVGDASTSFGIGVIIGKRWVQFERKEIKRGEGPHPGIAWLETVAIRISVIMLLKLGATPGRVFTVWTDNSTTLGAILKRKSKDLFANEEWKNIQHLLIKNKIDIDVNSRDGYFLILWYYTIIVF